MFRVPLKWLVVAFLAAIGSVCFAGTLTVTSPSNNAYISPSTDVNFNISGAVVQVTVELVTTFPDWSTSTATQLFSPASDGTASGSIGTNLSPSNPGGVYTLAISATEPNNTYAPTTLSVTYLPTAPEFNSFSPTNGTFESGTIHIRANINDAHLQQWTVQANSQNIPNNTGTTDAVSVDWNTANITKDGAQTITITATDLAQQTTTITINVTLCRISPIVTIEYPGTSTVIVPNSTITVALAIQGEFPNAVDPTGVDVNVMTTTGQILERVPFTSLLSNGTNTSVWTGRIRYMPGFMSKGFRLLVNAVDKAGNLATPQSELVTLKA